MLGLIGVILGAVVLGSFLGYLVAQILPLNCPGGQCDEPSTRILQLCVLGGAAIGGGIGAAANDGVRRWLEKRAPRPPDA